ncbi:MAG TPA: ion channel [Mycobacteriales bacterium]|nr:ion channel [Mycobacteriales bacterium]
MPSLLAPAGVLLLAATVLMWVTLLWAGVALVLLSGDPAVVHSQTQVAASPAQVVYVAGFSVFTLGVGDFVAESDTWRLFTAAMSCAGLALITLAITYLISVVSAVVDRRALAVHVQGLGRSPSDIVVRGWDGSAFSPPFQQHLVSLTGRVSTLAEQHLAYPVLQYFHTGQRAVAAPVALARLDDALLLLSSAVSPPARPAASATEPLRYAVERHLVTGPGTARADDAGPTPGAPGLEPLADAGIPLVPAAHYADAVARARPRRAALLRFVIASGWSWDDG